MLKKSFLIFASALFLWSCNSESTKPISTVSPNNNCKIQIYGKRAIVLDPLTTEIIVSGYGQSDTLMTEIYASGLDSTNVKFNWPDPDQCQVMITQQDDTKRNFLVRFSENGFRLEEMR